MTFEEFKEEVAKAVPQEKFKFARTDTTENSRFFASGKNIDIAYGPNLFHFSGDCKKISWFAQFRSMVFSDLIVSEHLETLESTLADIRIKYFLALKLHRDKMEHHISVETSLLPNGE